MKAIKIIFGIITFSLFIACNDEYLDRLPQTQLSPRNFFNNPQDLKTYSNGFYSMLPGAEIATDDAQSDNCLAVQASELTRILTAANASSENVTSGWDWADLRKINFFLENYQRVDTKADYKNHYAGVARFFRAMFYYNKIKRFGIVPWYSGTMGTGDIDLLYKTQDSRELVVDSVMADLDFAIQHIKEKADEYGTIDKWCALFLKSRIALHEGTFRRYHPELNLEGTASHFLEESRKASLEIMNSGNFSIYSTGNFANDYYNFFAADDYFDNKEVILSSVYDEKFERGSSLNYILYNYDFSMTKDLVNTYLMTDGTRFTDNVRYPTRKFVDDFLNRDPRLFQTVMGPGLTRNGEKYVPIVTPGGNPTGYVQRKFYIDNLEGTYYGDIPIYRYGEVLSNYAEATAELGLLTQTDIDISINLLRDRVGMPHMKLNYILTNFDPILEAQYPNVIGEMKGAILEIRRERRVELAGEGRRYDDLMRWYSGKLLEAEFLGMYFPRTGRYDMTGDDIADLILVEKMPPTVDQEEGMVYLSLENVKLTEGFKGNLISKESENKKFIEPKYYYRPVPRQQTILNPNLKQLFGWN
ncbi:MAG: RagB/SusD domain-containing [Prolixibacteraceae bacterium]|nr:MAG: RagB/SusD domain-containing [Prolixibacteraceae bacterium]